MLRGISGGQKKRVTTAEMVVGPKKTLFLDEISTGLVSPENRKSKLSYRKGFADHHYFERIAKYIVDLNKIWLMQAKQLHHKSIASS